MSYDGRFSDTITSIYDAAVDPVGWDAAIGRIARQVGAERGMFVGFSWTGDKVSFVRFAGSAPEFEDIYRQKWARNPWSDRAVERPVGSVFVNDEIIDLPTLERTEFYQEFLRPQDITYGLSGYLAGNPDFLAGMTLARGRSAGAFQKSELDTWRALVPHLQRAAQIQLRLAGWEPRATLALEMLDRLALGVVLLGANGDMVFANEAARRIAEARDGLRLDGMRVWATTSRDRSRLERLIADALNLGRREVSGGGGGMTLARAGGRLPLHVLVTPLVGTAAVALAGRCVAIFIRNPDDRPQHHDLLQQLFDLTPAEARVAALIAAGAGVGEAATATGIGRNTIKTHLARVFAKTGVRRQSELAALVGTLPRLRNEPGSGRGDDGCGRSPLPGSATEV